MRSCAAVVALLAVVTVAACATASTPATGGSVEGTTPASTRVTQVAADSLVPPGYGTLRQDDVTLSLRSDALLIKATPLAESVVRLLAPDTYNRLAGLARSHLEAAARQALVRDPLLVFVSFFSYQPNVTFQPEDLHIRSHSIRYRPLAILPMTPGWGAQRLSQQETQMAVYAYDSRVDLRAPFVVEYRQAQSLDWQQIIPKLDEERAKVRARAAPPRS